MTQKRRLGFKKSLLAHFWVSLYTKRSPSLFLVSCQSDKWFLASVPVAALHFHKLSKVWGFRLQKIRWTLCLAVLHGRTPTKCSQNVCLVHQVSATRVTSGPASLQKGSFRLRAEESQKTPVNASMNCPWCWEGCGKQGMKNQPELQWSYFQNVHVQKGGFSWINSVWSSLNCRGGVQCP